MRLKPLVIACGLMLSLCAAPGFAQDKEKGEKPKAEAMEGKKPATKHDAAWYKKHGKKHDAAWYKKHPKHNAAWYKKHPKHDAAWYKKHPKKA